MKQIEMAYQEIAELRAASITLGNLGYDSVAALMVRAAAVLSGSTLVPHRWELMTDLRTQDWLTLKRQQDGLRAFWNLPEASRPHPCGAAWIADYGPLPCALPMEHDGMHCAYGSAGAIMFGDSASAQPSSYVLPDEEAEAGR